MLYLVKRIFMISKKLIIIIVIFILFLTNILSQVRITLNTDTTGINVNPYLYGIFFEDINHAADGGLYAEMISNRSFEDDHTNPVGWSLILENGANGFISLDNKNLLNDAQNYCLKFEITSIPKNARAGISNYGFWGINIKYGEKYNLSFYARSYENFKGKITVSLESYDGKTIFAKNTITGLSTNWNKFNCSLISNGTTSQGRLVISVDTIGTIWFDVISLFPPTYKNRENGLRQDIAKMIEDLKPSFMRFPGGCFVEGDYMVNRFQWKKTIGKIENRPGHWNLWGYRTTDGLGYHEYLQFAEDIGADAMFVVNVGLAHNDYVPYNQLDSLIQEALDAIEYAIGDTTTKYGKLRSQNGHPQPFNLKFIELGNENAYGDHYAERYIAFYNAIKAKYPILKIIGNVEAWGTDYPSWKINAPVDLIDEHYYRDPQWFIDMSTRYDKYDRNTPKVYVGEYAVTSGCGYGNLIAAVAEAAFMTGFEKNADIVHMSSYAPLLVNVNNRAWNPDLINFNSSQCYGTPSYYVQKMFSNNIGDLYIPIKEENNKQNILPVIGKIGIGTWITQSLYDDILVINNDKNDTIFFDNFEKSNVNWYIYKGTWNIQNGSFAQSSNLEDCRAIAEYISENSYTIKLKAKKTSGNEGFLIIFGYKDDNNFYWWNIGGWNNTRHAIEKCTNGSKSQIANVNGSVVTNKWYDIRIELNNGRIKCYLDNILIHDYIPETNKLLYVSTTKNTQTDEYIMKVINVTENPVSTNINIKNKTGTMIKGINYVLTSDNKTDENSFSDPYKVAPVNISFTYPMNFSRSFPAYSVNVMRFKIINETGKNENKFISNYINILPNPITDIFTIEMPKTEIQKNFKLIISNVNGKIFKDVNFVYNGQNLFRTEGLNTGIYFVNIISNEINISKKIVIIK